MKHNLFFRSKTRRDETQTEILENSPVEDLEHEGETTVLTALNNYGREDGTVSDEEDIGLTTVLNQEHEKAYKPDICAWFIRLRTGEKFTIVKRNSVMGCSSHYSDFVIEGNSAISRKHAAIQYRDGAFFFMDLESTNKSYIEGKEIPAFTPIELSKGMLFSLADDGFQFCVQDAGSSLDQGQRSAEGEN